jgi:hypothetical protein
VDVLPLEDGEGESSSGQYTDKGSLIREIVQNS